MESVRHNCCLLETIENIKRNKPRYTKKQLKKEFNEFYKKVKT
jgi:hypothetical protein